MNKYHYHKDGTVPKNGAIFVFGSNTAGRHGKGAALAAKEKFGARRGIGEGLTGNAYGIPTKNGSLEVLSLKRIRAGVRRFREHTKRNKEETYFVTRVGCGLADYKDSQIAPFFRGATRRCSFPMEWKEWLE